MVENDFFLFPCGVVSRYEMFGKTWKSLENLTDEESDSFSFWLVTLSHKQVSLKTTNKVCFDNFVLIFVFFLHKWTDVCVKFINKTKYQWEIYVFTLQCDSHKHIRVNLYCKKYIIAWIIIKLSISLENYIKRSTLLVTNNKPK